LLSIQSRRVENPLRRVLRRRDGIRL
jgi:hypothetical protein